MSEEHKDLPREVEPKEVIWCPACNSHETQPILSHMKRIPVPGNKEELPSYEYECYLCGFSFNLPT